MHFCVSLAPVVVSAKNTWVACLRCALVCPGVTVLPSLIVMSRLPWPWLASTWSSVQTCSKKSPIPGELRALSSDLLELFSWVQCQVQYWLTSQLTTDSFSTLLLKGQSSVRYLLLAISWSLTSRDAESQWVNALKTYIYTTSSRTSLQDASTNCARESCFLYMIQPFFCY